MKTSFYQIIWTNIALTLLHISNQSKQSCIEPRSGATSCCHTVMESKWPSHSNAASVFWVGAVCRAFMPNTPVGSLTSFPTNSLPRNAALRSLFVVLTWKKLFTSTGPSWLTLQGSICTEDMLLAQSVEFEVSMLSNVMAVEFYCDDVWIRIRNVWIDKIRYLQISSMVTLKEKSTSSKAQPNAGTKIFETAVVTDKKLMRIAGFQLPHLSPVWRACCSASIVSTVYHCSIRLLCLFNSLLVVYRLETEGARILRFLLSSSPEVPQERLSRGSFSRVFSSVDVLNSVPRVLFVPKRAITVRLDNAQTAVLSSLVFWPHYGWRRWGSWCWRTLPLQRPCRSLDPQAGAILDRLQQTPRVY